MSGVQNLEVPETDDGSRLDRWFKRLFPHVSHGQVEKFLRTGQVRVDGGRVKGSHRLEAGQVVRIPPLPDPSEKKTVKRDPKQAQAIRDMIIFENDICIALNKPFGLAVQGGTKTKRHIDGMLNSLGEGYRLVHRLDRDTSGVLVIAKSASAAKLLANAFARRDATKIYWGITNGIPRPTEGEIKGYVVKGERGNEFGNKLAGQEIMIAARHGTDGAKYAKTLYRCQALAGNRAAWMVMQPLTGRTHQLRLHAQLLGAPLIGDPKYLTDRPAPEGLADKLHLHARELTLPLKNGQSLTFTASLPEHMAKSFDMLGFNPKEPVILPEEN